MQWLQGDIKDIKKEKAVANNGVGIPQHPRVDWHLRRRDVIQMTYHVV